MAKKASKKSPVKKVTVKKVTAKKATTKPAPKKAAGKKAVKKGAAANSTKIKVSPKQAAPKKAASKKTASKKAGSKQASSKATTKAAGALKQVRLASIPGKAGPMQQLEMKLRSILDANKKIKLEWDCGGDETLIHGYIDKKIWRADEPEFETLCEILIEELHLPNAGELFSEGGGTIELQQHQILVNYETTLTGSDWDEEAEEEIDLTNEKLQGQLLLFK